MDFPGTLLFEIWFYSLDYRCTLLFDVLLDSLDCHYIYNIYCIQLRLMNFLIPCFLICNVWCSTLHIFFFLCTVSWIHISILISLFNWLSFYSWIIVTCSLFSVDWHSVLFHQKFNEVPETDRAVNIYKFHLKAQIQWVSIVINLYYIIFQVVQCIKF